MQQQHINWVEDKVSIPSITVRGNYQCGNIFATFNRLIASTVSQSVSQSAVRELVREG